MGAGAIDRKLIVLGLAAFLAGSGVAAFGPAGLGPGAAYEAGCASLDEGWDQLALEPERNPVQTSGDQAFRLVRWEVDDREITGGVASLCVAVGAIEVTTGDEDAVELTASIGAQGEDAEQRVREIQVEAHVIVDGASLGVVAGEVGGPDGPPTSPSEAGSAVSLRLEVPEGTSWRVDADATVGEVEVDGLRLTELDARVGTGELDADELTTLGDVTATVDTGEIDLSLVPEASGRYGLDVGTGEIDIEVPRGSQLGYDVTGETGAGDVDLEIGPTEERTEGGEGGSSERARARTAGYADRSIQVEMRLTAGLGDIDVTAD